MGYTTESSNLSASAVKKVIVLNKKEGETPLEALELFRSKNKEYKDLPMTYAGRLDPMATGLLLVLAGDETKNKEKYLGLDKEYEFEVLFGLATDTYDILGKVIVIENEIITAKDLEKKIKDNLSKFKGKFIQKYPIYSSKTVKGKPLFTYGRSGEEVEIPEREVEVKNLKFIKLKKVKASKLVADVEKRILKVKGDFRQKEILDLWNKSLSTNKEEIFYIASFKTKCTSGTYVRGIANSLGEEMGAPALAYSIKRTKIGKFARIARW